MIFLFFYQEILVQKTHPDKPSLDLLPYEMLRIGNQVTDRALFARQNRKYPDCVFSKFSNILAMDIVVQLWYADENYQMKYLYAD